VPVPSSISGEPEVAGEVLVAKLPNVVVADDDEFPDVIPTGVPPEVAVLPIEGDELVESTPPEVVILIPSFELLELVEATTPAEVAEAVEALPVVFTAPDTAAENVVLKIVAEEEPKLATDA